MLVVAGLPGTWMMLIVAVVAELVDEAWLGPDATTFGWGWIVACAALALLGEGVELLGGMVGAKSAGSSRRGIVGAFAGGLVGALIGTFVLPVPLLGTLLGALIGTFLGALVGETTGEQARSHREALGPALAATVGRVFGTLAKTLVSLVVWITLSVAAFWP